MNNLFDLYLFDLDGTIVNTEHIHNMAYNMSFKFFNIIETLTFDKYCEIAHYDNIYFKDYIDGLIIKSNLNSITYDIVYAKKKEIFINLLDNIEFMEGIELFLNNLFENKIKTCIVTHSDRDVVNKIVEKLPLLNNIDVFLTKHDYLHKKPHPECYIKALSLFPNIQNPIGFEDSYRGFVALASTNITPVFINNSNYFYISKIKSKYSDANIFNTINELNIHNVKIKQYNNINNFITQSFNKYYNGLNILKSKMSKILLEIIPMIKNGKNNIYLTGIGKCGHICKKSVSTWQSLGISCNYLYIPDLFHGDFGILKNGDIIIYISNSGNTDEIINCSKYIKNCFKITQIAFTMNKNCLIKDIVDLHYSLVQSSSDVIYEIDNINMAPTTSSIIFMTLLDLIGTKVAEDNGLTLEKFKINHPGGDLGKRKNATIDYIVIVASGLGSRLKPITNYIPKILVTINNKTFVELLIEYWQQICSNIIIILDSQYNEIIKFYTEKYCNITILNYNFLSGTAETIASTIDKKYHGKNILFSWCDILINEKFKINQLTNNTIFTYGNECRYGFDENKKIKQMSNGNIIGIYYIKNYKGFGGYRTGEDICDIYNINYDDFNEYEIKNLIDIGDMNKLTLYHYSHNNNCFNTRFFNNIVSTNNNTLIKRSVELQGNDIIINEISWYKYLSSYNIDYIPNIFNYNEYDFEFEMEKVNAEPLYLNFNNFDDDKKIILLKDIYDILDNLHSIRQNKISMEEYNRDIQIECHEKIISRLNKVKSLLDYFGSIEYVNDIFINNDINYVLDKCLNNIKNNANILYSIIHGDCQFSNILYNKDTNKITLIDPRGYFGKSKIFGDKNYDYAKVLYALSGYDNFNNNNLYYITNYDRVNKRILFEINNNLHLIDSIKKEIGEKYINISTISYLVIIWLGLAQYNQNNILKCVTSYYNGLYLFAKYLE
jgi:D-arabinose 5-phosphate isomerase GutQ/beta-phosphoglucomutase-like phosphatase (HAD superfamily)/choline kinase